MNRVVPPRCDSIVEVIGCTPMLELHQAKRVLGLQGRLLAKLEYLNPGFSKKDRIAREMVMELKRTGALQPGQPVIELTSGNTGTGLAIVCRALGHPFIAVMSRGNTVERARMMRALGAEVVLVDQAPGSPPNQVSGADLALVERRTAELVLQRQAVRANQFLLQASSLAHERTTGPELWQQSEGDLDVFVDFVGTGGSFAGVMRHLKQCDPAIRGYVVEPASAAVLAGRAVTNPSHVIQGGGYSMNPLPLLDPALAHGYVQVTDQEAQEMAHLLAAEEGVFAGFSSGANLAAAVSLLRGAERGATVGLLLCDSGLKYLSTNLWT